MQDTVKSLIATSLAHFVNDGTMYVFIMLYPIFVQNYSISVLEVGILGAVLNAFSIVASPIIGRRSDASRNYAGLLTLGLVLMGVGVAGYALSVLYFSGLALFVILIPFAIVAGVGSSFYHPLGATILNEQWSPGSRGRALGINGAIGSIGRTIYPVIVVALVIALTVPSVTLMGVLAVAISAATFLMLRGASITRGIQQGKAEKKGGIPIRLLLPSILVLTIVSFVRGVFTNGIQIMIPVYLTQVSRINYGYDLGLIIVVMNAMGVISQPLFGWIGDKLGRRFGLALSNAGTIIAIILFLTTQNPIFLTIFLALFGLFSLNSFPLLMALTMEAAPEEAMTTASSIVWGVANVGGSAAGPALIGLLAEPIFFGSLNSAFFITALIGVLSIVLIPLIPRHKRT